MQPLIGRLWFGRVFCKQTNVAACRFQNECNKVEIALRVVQFWSEIKLVITNRTPALRSCDFVITRLISDQIALHSVQLPLLIRNSKSNYTRNLFRKNVNTPNKFWKHIKKCFPTKEVKGSNSKVFNIDGNVTSDTKKIANGFSKFFAKIGKNLQQK